MGRAALAAWIAPLVVMAATLVFFLPAYAYDYEAHEGYVWDDADHYLLDHLIEADDGWWRIWFDPQPGLVGASGAAAVWNYWPATRSSFWLDRHLFEGYPDGRPNLFASHLINVLLHGLNAVLLLFALRALRFPGAELAALLFALHPVTVESVAWLTERKNLLSTLFFLAALLAWQRFREREEGRWYLFTAVSFLLALLAKTATVMFPVVIVALHWYERRPFAQRDVLRFAPFFAMSLIAGLTSVVFERTFIGSTHSALDAGWPERIATTGHVLWFYLGKVLLPLGISFNYPRWAIDAGSLMAWLPLLGALALAVGLWTQREGPARAVALAIGCFAVQLFPVLGLFGVYGMRYAHVADHWQYLACMSVIALVAGLLSRTPRPLYLGVGALAAVGCAALTWHHSGAYVDRATLWDHVLAQEPSSYLAHNNVGTRLLGERDYAGAIAHFEQAIEADPSNAEPYANIGNAISASTRSMARAAPWWEKAVERDATQAQSLYNLAAHQMNQGKLDAAEPLLRRALEARPTYEAALRALARIYKSQGTPEAVLPYLDRAEAPPKNRTAEGRSIVLAYWGWMALPLGASVWIARRG